jgi:molybdenum cofactor cytidylyltransferase
METGAVVAAAGMSSRMGDFKPMLNIGSISVAKRVISTLQQAGVKRIVIVTGYQAELLEHHLSNMGVVFLRNENYRTTEMFDSARIGLAYLKDKCDKILFTPVDIPLFTAATVRKLLRSEAKLAAPEHGGIMGHPILLHATLVDAILCDSGEGGLKCAIQRLGIGMTSVPVNDSGTLRDADTPEEFEELLKLHNEQLMRPVVSLKLAKEITFLDEKLVMLLQLVEETGSVRKACVHMQISYSSGWNMLHSLESQLSSPLIVRSQGGPKGGESRLTPEGKKIITRYKEFEEELKTYADFLYEKYFDGVF